MSLAYMYPANCRFLVSRLLSVTQLCSWHSQRRDRYITICAVQFATRCLPWILGQIELPMIVLESAHHEDSETPPTHLIWWNFSQDTLKTQSKLHKFKESMTVLESACHEDSETPPTCLIWWSFGWVIWG